MVFWKGRVDRGCVERMKAFQNPPLLVGQVMEMVMLLVGKRLPSHPQRSDRDHSAGYPIRDEQSGRYSTTSSNSTRFAMSKKGIVGLMLSSIGIVSQYLNVFFCFHVKELLLVWRRLTEVPGS